jgi:drug/metabolite transporter (DMT)-like permease
MEKTKKIKGNVRKGTTLALTAACLWGMMGLLVRRLTAAGLTGMEIAFFRCLLAGVVSLCFYGVRQPKMLKTDGKGLAIGLGYGVVAYSFSFLTYNVAVQRIPMGPATVLMFMSPIWVSLLARVVFGDRLWKFQWGLIGLCLLGGILVSNVLLSGTGGRLDSLGVAAGVANGFGMAMQLLIPRFFQGKYARETLLTYGFLGAAVFLAFFADFGQAMQAFRHVGVIRDMLLLGIFCTFISNSFYVKAPAYIGAAATSVLASAEVIFAQLVGFFVYHEALHPLQGVGMILILLAMALFGRKR